MSMKEVRQLILNLRHKISFTESLSIHTMTTQLFKGFPELIRTKDTTGEEALSWSHSF